MIAFSNENAIWSVKLDNSFPKQNWTAYLPTIFMYLWQIMVVLCLGNTICLVQQEAWKNWEVGDTPIVNQSNDINNSDHHSPTVTLVLYLMLINSVFTAARGTIVPIWFHLRRKFFPGTSIDKASKFWKISLSSYYSS